MKLDLEAQNLLDELANHSNISKFESKLPMNISIDWSKEIIDEDLNKKPSKEKFLAFMKFLNKAKERIDYLVSQNAAGGCAKSTTQMNFVVGSTFTAKAGEITVTGAGKKVKPDRFLKPCLACNVDGATNLTSIIHPMATCSVWNSLTHKERERKVKCVKHPFTDDHATQECTTSGRKCKICQKDNHHFLLCPQGVRDQPLNPV